MRCREMKRYTVLAGILALAPHAYAAPQHAAENRAATEKRAELTKQLTKLKAVIHEKGLDECVYYRAADHNVDETPDEMIRSSARNDYALANTLHAKLAHISAEYGQLFYDTVNRYWCISTLSSNQAHPELNPTYKQVLDLTEAVSFLVMWQERGL